MSSSPIRESSGREASSSDRSDPDVRSGQGNSGERAESSRPFAPEGDVPREPHSSISPSFPLVYQNTSLELGFIKVGDSDELAGWNSVAHIHESILTDQLLQDIPELYQFGDGFRCMPFRSDLRASTALSPKYMCSYLDHLECGLRFPLHPTLEALLRYYDLALPQISPNSIRCLTTFLVACQEITGHEASLNVVRHFFSAKCMAGGNYYVHITPRKGGLIDLLPTSIKYWKYKFFFVECPTTSGVRSSWRLFDKFTKENKEPTDLHKTEFQQIRQIISSQPYNCQAFSDEDLTRAKICSIVLG